jgi:hypothetical protein
MSDTSLPQASYRDSLPQQMDHRGPGSDPLKYLPQRGGDKLRMLQQHVEDCRGLLPPFDRRHEVGTEKVQIEHEIRRLMDHTGFRLPETDPRVRAAKERLDEINAERDRLTALTETRTKAYETATATLSNVLAYLRDGRPPGTIFELVEPIEPKLLAKESISDAIARLRRRGDELKAELAKISSAPFPSSYTKRRMREQIEQLAARGRPDVTMLIKNDANVGFPQTRLKSQVLGGAESALAFTEVPDTLALFTWLHKEPLLAALSGLVDGESDDSASLTHEARQTREADVQGTLLDTERQEAELIWQSHGQVEPRADTDVCALLGLRLVVAPVAASTGSSPELSWPVVQTGQRR